MATTPAKSKQPRFTSVEAINNYIFHVWEEYYTSFPEWGSPARTQKLREAVRVEPILAGATASVVKKISALDWSLTGPEALVEQSYPVLIDADGGAGWDIYLQKLAQDYLCTDIGAITELARPTRFGPVTAIYHLDAAACELTGSTTYPLYYLPKIGNAKEGVVKFTPLDFARIVDMPSADERKFNLGFCAVSRALKAARILLALYNYDEEKLADMPLAGLVSVTGMTMEELEDAFKLYDATRSSKGQQVFKGLLWLAAQTNALQPIKADLLSFASLPEGFDRNATITLYVYTLALDFGVDVREFWPASQVGATKAEAQIQHQKAKGKGFGELVSSIEYMLSEYVLPEGVKFRFAQLDTDTILAEEAVRAGIIENVRKLWEPANTSGLGIINTDEARRLLVDAKALPEWIETDETMQESDDVTMTSKAAGDNPISISKAGVITKLTKRRNLYALPDRASVFAPTTAAQRNAAIAHLQAAGLLITNPDMET